MFTLDQTKTHFNLLYPLDVEPEVTKPQSQTTNLLTESLKNAQKKKKSIFDDSDDSESDSENDVYQDTTNDSTKGQLISKSLFGFFKFFQEMNENKSTWGIIVVKSIFFVRFLEELRIPKSPFENNWPLEILGISSNTLILFIQSSKVFLCDFTIQYHFCVVIEKNLFKKNLF